MKKFLAVALTLALTLALFAFPLPANAAVTTGNTTNVLFEDDFNSYTATTGAAFKTELLDKGFSIAVGNGTDYFTDATYAHNNKLTVPHGSELYVSTGNVEGSDTWSEYSVSVDVTYDAELAERSTNSYAMVVLNVTGVARGGYEFGINYTQTNGAKLLFRRANSSENFDVITYKNANTNIVFGEEYNLKLTYKAGIVYAYIDGDLFASHNTVNDIDGIGDDADNILMLKEGPAGFRKRGTNFQISFDNFKVEKEEKTVWFNEDFSYESVEAMNAAGWDISAKNYTNSVNNGTFAWDITSPYALTLANRNETAAWDDYSVEADFTIGEVTAIDETQNSTNQIQYFGLLGRVNGDKGYECSVSVSTSGKMSLRIRRDTIYLPSKDDDSVSIGTYEAGVTHNLKMEFIGNTINCYFNGKLVRTVTDDTYTKGTVGLKMFTKPENSNNSANVSVDNLKVTGYIPVTEYFNQGFYNSPLSNENYTQYSSPTKLELTDNNFSGGTFNVSEGTEQAYGLYNTSVNSDNYTVELDVTIPNDPVGSGSIGVAIGTENTNKTGIWLYIAVSSAGKINTAKLVHRPEKPSAVTDANSDYYKNVGIAYGNKVHIKLSIVPGMVGENPTSTATAIITGDSKSITLKRTVNESVSGYCGIMAQSDKAPAIYDNFKAYPNSYYVSPTIGELDGDGIVTSADGRYIREYLLGANDATVADLNNDTYSDIRDLVHFTKVFEFYK